MQYKLSTVVFLFFLLFFFPDSGICRTPSDLAHIIQNFNQSNTPEEQLDLSYSGLDLYAPIANKSSVDPEDRTALSKMKRLVLTNAIAKAGGNVLIAGIGSTGNWVASRPGMIVNDYPANNQDAIVQLKLKGCYMEGLSDLDFVVMGQGAGDYQNKIYRIFAEGRGNVHLTPEEMNELEINFITDEQIKSLASGPEGRKFWKQLMDLSNSSAHAEKYITKGGKALYGMNHLYENGAVITRDKQKPAMVFSEYAGKNGHKMGPFTLPHLFGGACDMDYFIAHTLDKNDQENVKSVLQVIKYLKRDEWMLRRAAKNLALLPKELAQTPETVQILNNYAADIAQFTDSAIKKKVWKSDQSKTQFGKDALALSGLVGSSAHEMLIKIGNELLWLRSIEKLTPTTSAILTSLVYDLETVDKKRYQGKYPAW
ncbi:MAG: hypothetical protein V2I50_10690, partial [Desulfuromusa sp.]|nr:hypothetical protein [Desulfuromusa sp.]